MSINPDTNKFEMLIGAKDLVEVPDDAGLVHEMRELIESRRGGLVRPDGSPVPKHWTTFQLGELVVIKNYTFEVKYIGETAILFEPVGPMEVEVGK